MTGQPIRVAMVTQGYYPLLGGAERQLANVAPLLEALGVEVQVVTRRHPGLERFEMVGNVPVHRLPIPGPKPTRSTVFTLAALPLLSRLRPDVIHAYGLFSPATTAVAAKRRLGTPVVVKILRSGDLGDVFRLKRKLFGQRRIESFRRRVDAFIAISREIDAELAGIGVPAERRPYIPNGIDTSRYAPAAAGQKSALRRQLGLPDGPIVVFTGRLSPEKRVGHLLDIWPEVRSACPEAMLLLLGSGPDEAALKRRDVPGVRFAGLVDDVLPYLQAADLFVLPSIAEGLSNALMEAMAVGLPAVATNVGGASDLIEDQASGWLVPPDDAGALRQGVRCLLADTERRVRFGDQARARIVAGYSLQTVALQLRQLYDRVIARNALVYDDPEPARR